MCACLSACMWCVCVFQFQPCVRVLLMCLFTSIHIYAHCITSGPLRVGSSTNAFPVPSSSGCTKRVREHTNECEQMRERVCIYAHVHTHAHVQACVSECACESVRVYGHVYVRIQHPNRHIHRPSGIFRQQNCRQQPSAIVYRVHRALTMLPLIRGPQTRRRRGGHTINSGKKLAA